MRLKSKIWVQAYIRGCASRGASAVVIRHGDDDAGAIFIRVSLLDGTSSLYGPAPAGLSGSETERTWVSCLQENPTADREADAYLERQYDFDSDLWLIEVEDRDGRHFLDDWLA